VPFLWKSLEVAYVAQAKHVALRVIRQNPRHIFYAVALQESYRELDGSICLPYLALNSIEEVRSVEADGPYDMASANWKWTTLRVVTPELKKLQRELNAEANRSIHEHWYRTEKCFLSRMVSVSKRLFAELKKHKQTTPDFCVYFDDEEGGEDLARRCMPKSLYAKLFPDDETAMQPKADLPTSKKLERYLADIYTYENEIASLGEASIDSLIPKLTNGEDGCTAARLLARIGAASPVAIRALRRQVRDSSRPGINCARWCSYSLAMLGDNEYLFTLAEDESRYQLAVEGLCFQYRGFGSPFDWPHRPRLDYRHLERILDRWWTAWTRVAEGELSPGRGFVSIKADEVEEALRGLRSPHLLIRQHAVCILDDRALGPAAGKRILPALVECLGDTHPNVRRLAILSISRWKAAAMPYRPDIKRLCRDDDPGVRRTARSVLR
jgi:hypothetical protein